MRISRLREKRKHIKVLEGIQSPNQTALQHRETSISFSSSGTVALWVPQPSHLLYFMQARPFLNVFANKRTNWMLKFFDVKYKAALSQSNTLLDGRLLYIIVAYKAIYYIHAYINY